MIDIKDIYYGMQESQKVFALLGAGFMIGFGISQAVKFACDKIKEKRDEEEFERYVSQWGSDDDIPIYKIPLDDFGYSDPDGGEDIVTYPRITAEDMVAINIEEKPDIFSLNPAEEEPLITSINAREYTFDYWVHRHSMVYYVDDDILADAETLEEVSPEEMHADGYLEKIKGGEAEDVYYSIPSKMESYEIIASHGNYLEEFQALEESNKEAEATSYEDVIKIAGYSEE